MLPSSHRVGATQITLAVSHPPAVKYRVAVRSRNLPDSLDGIFAKNGISQSDAVADVSRQGYFRDVIRALFLSGMFLALGACDDACSNDVITRTVSPDGKREAVMFQRDCGATSGYSTQISIVDAGEAPAGGGNTFRADGDHGAASLGYWGGSWAETKWIASDRLLVRYADKSRIFEEDDTVAGVSVSYEAVAM